MELNTVNSNIHGTDGFVNANTGVTESYNNGGLSAEMKTFYDKALIEFATPNLVHMQFGQKRPIPANNGRTVEFRRMKPLAKNTNTITEGITPGGTKMTVVPLTATLNQYGDYIEQTDLIEMTSIDNTVIEATKLLADQAGRTIDTIVRDVLQTGTNVNYCSTFKDGVYTPVTSRAGLDETAKLRVVDVFKAAAQLKAVNAPTIDGKYVAIIHPHVAFDLMQEAGDAWVDIKKYAEPEKILNGELGTLGGVRFVESSEAKINYGKKIINDIESINSSSLSIEDGGFVDDENGGIPSSYSLPVFDFNVCPELVGKYLQAYNENTDTAATFKVVGINNMDNKMFIDRDIASIIGEAENYTLYCGEGGKKCTATYSTIFLGRDAYGIIDINGNGAIEHIVKQRGYGNDPLNQRSSIGWKAFMCAAILADDYILRVESGSSFSPDITEGN